MHALAFALCAFVLSSVGELRAQNWIQAAGIPGKEAIGLTEHGEDIYAISLDSVYRSRDSGTTWLPTPVQPGHGDNLVTLHSHAEYVYLGTTNDGVYRSVDGGVRWELFGDGYPGGAAVEFLSLGDSLFVGTGANGVYVRNTILSSSWTPYNDGLERFGVETMAASGDLLVANIGLSTYARKRGSPAWTEFLIDTTGGQLAVNKFFSFGNYLFAGVGLGVYRGAPDATGWQKVGINLLPYQPVVHFGTHRGRLLAAVRYKLEHFICYSDDSGSTWGVQDHQLAELISLKVIGNRLFAARADGLWRMELGVPTGVDQGEGGRAAGFGLEQNWPNPFNPFTIIKYTVGGNGVWGVGDGDGAGMKEMGAGGQGPGSRKTMLAVYDVLGRQVATLVDEVKAPGSYEVRFDARRLSSGVYVYRLTAGSYVESRRMILLR